jgi:hypothetical protein
MTQNHPPRDSFHCKEGHNFASEAERTRAPAHFVMHALRTSHSHVSLVFSSISHIVAEDSPHASLTSQCTPIMERLGEIMIQQAYSSWWGSAPKHCTARCNGHLLHFQLQWQRQEPFLPRVAEHLNGLRRCASGHRAKSSLSVFVQSRSCNAFRCPGRAPIYGWC